MGRIPRRERTTRLQPPPAEETTVRRRGVSLKALVTVSRLLATLDFEEILDQIVRASLDLVGADRGFLFLAEDEGALSMRVGRTSLGAEIPPSETPEISLTLVRRSMEQRRCLYVRDVRSDPSVAALSSVARLGIGSVLCLPMVLTDLGKVAARERRRVAASREVLGVIYLDRAAEGKPLSAEDFAAFQAMGNLAAAALVNASVYQEAIVDGLTGLAHRRHFEHALETEVERASKSRAPLSLLMADLDHFKLVNDTKGHPVGDRVLQQFARVLRSRARVTDLVARYGGEEFGVVLPDCPGPDALAIAEEIRLAARETSARQGPLPVTVSIGVATFDPASDRGKEDLVRRADAALYESKRRGRDRATAWSPTLSVAEGKADDLLGLFSGEPSRDYRTMRMLLQVFLEGASASEDTEGILRRTLLRVRDAVSGERAALYSIPKDGPPSAWVRVGAEGEATERQDDAAAAAALRGDAADTGRWADLLRRGGDLVGALVITGAAGWPRAQELILLEALRPQLALLVQEALARDARRRVAEEEKERLSEENERLARGVLGRGLLLGESSGVRTLFDGVRRVASSDASVLVVGETGTGKESIARLLHDLSRRARSPYVVVDCTSIPKTLIEGELFGHEKGAFTGADDSRRGLLEAAQGGTVFFDEVTELPAETQAKLLRFLQEGEARRVGSNVQRKLDVRVVAATNRDPEAEVQAGRLRSDLYYRLRVVLLRVPPLRERGDDVALLARHFLARHARSEGRRIAGFSDAALQALARHDWPGNVRELEHRVQRAVLFAAGDRIEPPDLEFGGAGPSPARGLRAAVDRLEREMIERALADSKGNVSRAAEALGLTRTTLQALMKGHDIDRARFQA